ncbi:succinate dehydrogenase, hydrophobic membrane anchor protein (plasmid) [Legionella adelaidensis]|uniref:Succinate dehydrogenase hydrophobic membrane anchor subunit n=1 Tax=Legionella adelaidensis TaxID=45056 RepID=A0A0W0R609_9GAMM|nr:succinate dehydrogenase, hydrophobic membrane anchor protein [Legionella adelaidensis]KTC66462.1 succinate dehydrogenase, hydrophobic membrane anchor protein [Legionella adelaidensis]VEH86250.1 succinate dehydrogenase, hydrophobic membrane anchor protein [Legionella adelaidensis]
MVPNVTSLTGNGLKDWLIQRLTAVYFAVYCLFLLGFIIAHPGMRFEQWLALFHFPFFKIATIIALLAFLLHTWIGIWTVTTDYITCTAIRLTVQSLVLLVLLAQLVGGIMIVWGQ